MTGLAMTWLENLERLVFFFLSLFIMGSRKKKKLLPEFSSTKSDSLDLPLTKPMSSFSTWFYYRFFSSWYSQFQQKSRKAFLILFLIFLTTIVAFVFAYIAWSRTESKKMDLLKSSHPAIVYHEIPNFQRYVFS